MTTGMQLLICRTVDQPSPLDARQSDCPLCGNRIWISGLMMEPVAREEVFPICHECCRRMPGPGIDNQQAVAHPRQLSALADRGPYAQTAAVWLVRHNPVMRVFDELVQERSHP
jgi:hypothetical protein